MTTTMAPSSTTHSDASLPARQSLAHGPLGTALCHIARAHRGTVNWQAIHQQLSSIGPLAHGAEAGLYLGAPAMAYVLHLAAGDTGRYQGALRTLDGIVAAHTRHRLEAARTRMNTGRLTSFAEYDIFRGLTGIGALLLRRQPESAEMAGVLEYMVRLTQPVTGPGGAAVPGWWVGHAPTSGKRAAPGEHANAGMAHGIAGPLALLALARLHGVTVAGQDDAMRRICHWLDQIRTSDHHGTRWPRWVHTRGATPTAPGQPSWCYGTPGLARAQQLAAIALNDLDRKRMAERALLHCLSDSRQLDQLTIRGLCHGLGGLLRTVQRVAQDAEEPHLFTGRIPALQQRFLQADPGLHPGFLTGTAGAALAFQHAEPDHTPAGDWDVCLLLN